MLTAESIFGIGCVAAGLIIGIGMLIVQIEDGELDKLNRFFPGIRVYHYKITRYVVSLIGFFFALFGLANILGWV